MSANGIAHLATKELRQKAKLDLAATDRAEAGKTRSVYDITQLPTQYVDNAVVNNPDEGGLVVGRPWVTFMPISLFASGEKGVWYEPSDITTLFQDVAGTIPVTAHGQSVALMLDKSGNNAHATQSDATKRPTYYEYSDGYGALRFDGTNDFMVTSNINFTGTAKLTSTVGIQVSPTAGAGSRMIVELSADASANNGAFFMTGPSSLTDHSIGLRGTVFIAAHFANVSLDDDCITAQLDISQATKELELIPRLNGSVRAVSSWPQGVPSAGTGNFGNHPLYIGSRGGTSVFFKGHMYGIVIRGAQSTSTEVTNTEAWVTRKLD